MAIQHGPPHSPILDNEEEELRRLTRAVLRLSRTALACLKLRYLHRMSDEEIAEFLHLPVSEVRSNVSRALRLLEQNGASSSGPRSPKGDEP